jgi:hypothetical protein
MRLPRISILGFAILGLLMGCHQKHPQASPGDVEAAQEEARHEVEQARTEARKDIRSAAKIDARNVVAARVTGSYDIAMAQADGEHKVAIEQCLTLPLSAQQSCKDQADAAYEAAAATAKAARVSHP